MKHNMLQEGAVRPRPPLHRSQSHTGIHPLSPLTHRTQRFQPLPPALGEPPYHYDLETAVPDIGKVARDAGKLVFHVVGDTGGIKHPEYQMSVAKSMKEDLNKDANERPNFFYHLGDVIYYNGELNKYYDQFYEPYDHYEAPIIGIPGNHDGDPIDSSQTSLDGWIAYFMTATPHVDPISQDAPRVTLSLPNVYFTLVCPYATIIGMYTNVPEHGSIDSGQQQWLTNEFATAPKDKALILCLHHPIYSFDDHHSGSPGMADAVQHAINDSRRIPNIVLSAHVHNYQRIERNDIIEGSPSPFIVAGHGGYYHLHNFNKGVVNGAKDSNNGSTLVASDDKNHGYLTLSVDSEKIAGSMTTIDKQTEEPNQGADAFEYSAKALFLAEKTVSL
jgi:acid phosphatase type 7